MFFCRVNIHIAQKEWKSSFSNECVLGGPSSGGGGSTGFATEMLECIWVPWLQSCFGKSECLGLIPGQGMFLFIKVNQQQEKGPV